MNELAPLSGLLLLREVDTTDLEQALVHLREFELSS